MLASVMSSLLVAFGRGHVVLFSKPSFCSRFVKHLAQPTDESDESEDSDEENGDDREIELITALKCR